GARSLASMAVAVMAFGPPPGRKAPENTAVALRVLELRAPLVEWRRPALRADVTGDGVPDLAVAGIRSSVFEVAVIEGPAAGGSRMVRVSWKVGDDDLDAACIRDAHLSLEELPTPPGLDAATSLALESARRQGAKGLRVD